jgi:hypothetical protein
MNIFKTNMAITVLLCCMITGLHAQNTFPSTGAAGIGTTTPDASSLLEIKSITKGLLIPRMTLAQRNLIATPATGLMIYQTNSTPGFYYYNGTAWTAVSPKGVNTSNASLRNTSIGLLTLSANTTGDDNTATGYQSLHSNTTGEFNTADGEDALASNTTGYDNTANGQDALASNTTGYDNTANGSEALHYNTIGWDNTANGYGALDFNTVGSGNTANGADALFNNDTGTDNTADGGAALHSNTTGSHNTANGVNALESNTTGNENTANGDGALIFNSTGSNNTANGEDALEFNTTGHENTANGEDALFYNTTGYENTALGVNAGYNITTGSNNTFLGYNANPGGTGVGTNMTAIGYGAIVNASNHIVIGNTSVTHIGGYVNWSNLSDGRVKKNIKQNVPGLAFINKLQPITYNLDLDAADKIIDPPQLKDKDGKIIQPSQIESDARKAKEQIVYTGFIAQDVEKSAKELNYDFSGVDKPDNANTLYGLRYSDFVVPLVKAVQELSKMNDAKDSVINDLQQKYNNQQKQIDELKTMIVSGQSSLVPSNTGASIQQSTAFSSASLSQNIPNPFNNSTTISYSISQQFSSAKIIITDKNGNALKQIDLTTRNGNVAIPSSFGGGREEASGAYQYALYVDGKMIASKQMILSK